MGLRILIVEDEMTIALMLEEMAIGLGHDVVGVPMRIAPALRAAQTLEIDFALLDINLDGVKSYPLARVLQDRDIPFAFATGYGAQGVDGEFQGQAVLQKPFTRTDLANMIDLLVDGGPSPLADGA